MPVQAEHRFSVKDYYREVWIVNLKEKSIEVYRDTNFTGYANKAVLRPGDQARIQAFPEVIVDLSELMRR